VAWEKKNAFGKPRDRRSKSGQPHQTFSYAVYIGLSLIATKKLTKHKLSSILRFEQISRSYYSDFGKPFIIERPNSPAAKIFMSIAKDIEQFLNLAKSVQVAR